MGSNIPLLSRDGVPASTVHLPRGDWALRLAVNTGLAQTYRNGQALEIFRKWFEPVGLRINGVMLAVYQFGALPD